MPSFARPSPRRVVLSLLAALAACGGAPGPAAREPALASASASAGVPSPAVGVDPAHIAAPIVDLVAPAESSVLLRGALVKSDAPPTDAWDPEAPVFARAYCIGDTCFRLVDQGERAVPPGTTLTAIGPSGACDVEITRARGVRAHLDAHAESAAVDQAYVLFEVGPCAAHPDARLETVFGARPVEVLSLRDAAWHPASAELAASLDAREEVTRALTPDRARVPIVAADVPECGITLARGLAIYWVREGTVNQPFDAARFVAAGPSLYAFSYVEGLDPLLERLDRVTCSAE